MTAPSPVALAVTPPELEVWVDGVALDSKIQILSVETWHGVNKLPRARLVVSDGSAPAESFAVSETAALVPGVSLRIALGYGGARDTVFSGVIHRQGLEFGPDAPPRLEVEASDKAMAMTLSRGCGIWADATDGEVCEALIGAAGLTAEVTASTTRHATVVQHHATAWDMLVLRAEACGMVVNVDDGTVTVAPPDTGTAPVLTLTFGQSLREFRAHVDAASQIAAGSVGSRAWDPATQALASSSPATAAVATPGNLSSDALAEVFGVAALGQRSSGAIPVAELTDWSSAALTKRRLAKLRGEARFIGSARVRPGSMVTLSGVGGRFEGDTYVSAVHHRYAHGAWVTAAEIGLAPAWFAERAGDIAPPSAAGRLPPAEGLHIGVVKQIHGDPDGHGRVLLTLPLLEAEGKGVWARFGAFYASKGVGANFYPEIGDEVAVGFLSGDPRYPVILGSLYSKAKPPPHPPAGEGPPNNVKSFTTRGKLRIDFVEDAGQILVKTPGGQSVDLNDKAGSVTLTDKHGNTVTMDAAGIAIASKTDISISAKGSITMTANAKIALDAKAALQAEAGTTAMLSAKGRVDVKGAVVALNS